MQEEYLDVLGQSLEKKNEILLEIRKKNEEQRVLLLDEDLGPEEFERNIDEKARLVEQLELLDQGFDEIYQRVRDSVQNEPGHYREQIERLQELIREVSANGNSIQVEEQRNFQLAQKKFATVKQQIKEVKSRHRIVKQYYQSMTGTTVIDSQFLDNKK